MQTKRTLFYNGSKRGVFQLKTDVGAVVWGGEKTAANGCVFLGIMFYIVLYHVVCILVVQAVQWTLYKVKISCNTLI